MCSSRSTRVCRCTSAIPTARGNAAATRTSMGCCASTFRRAPTSPSMTSRASTRSPLSSMHALDKRSAGCHLPKRSPVLLLRRSLETTPPGLDRVQHPSPAGGTMETKEFQRWIAKRKVELLLQLIRGERKLVDVCREHDLKQSEVEGWMDTFVKGGERSLKARAEDE